MELPRVIKRDQEPGYKSEWVKLFLQQWSVSHAFGIPHNSPGPKYCGRHEGKSENNVA